MVADKFIELQEAVGQEVTKAHLLVSFCLPLRDLKAEVRTTATNGLKGFCKALPDDVKVEANLQHILPSVQVLHMHIYIYNNHNQVY